MLQPPRLTILALASMLSILAWGAKSLPAVAGAQAEREAVAEIANQAGDSVGTVLFLQMEGGVAVLADLASLPPGLHGISVHRNARCDPESEFQTASGPWRLVEVAGFQTGGQMSISETGGDWGELISLYATATGTMQVSFIVDRFTVADLLADGGHSVVVHADRNGSRVLPSRDGVSLDQIALETGHAGRIACGIILPTDHGQGPAVSQQDGAV
jgi:superoxide dismutase, Cu-Zn family